MMIHRDYLGHCFRWSHAARLLGRSGKYKDSLVLDIGCGKEVPLGKLLYSNRFIPQAYCGVDVRDDLAFPEMIQKGIDSGKLTRWSLLSKDCAVLTRDDIGFTPNFITAFEIVEHVEADHRIKILKNIKNLIANNGTFLLSTPNYDYRAGAADNHVDETTHNCLGSIIEDCGWRITARYGTFASISDYRDRLFADYGEPAKQIFETLHNYYDTNVLATIFAPLYPALSRNICWELTPVNPDVPAPRVYPGFKTFLQSLPTEPDETTNWRRWLGSSEKWDSAEYRDRIVSMLE